MSQKWTILFVALISLIQLSFGFISSNRFQNALSSTPSSNSKLFSQRPQKKIIKKIMDRRPKKSRPSDINRNNVNLNVQLTQLDAYKAIPDYTIVSYEQYLQEKDEIEKVIENGDPNYPWEPVPVEGSIPVFNRNRKLLSKSELKKIEKHPLWKNRDPKNYRNFVPSEKMQKIIDEFEGKLIKVDDFNNIPTEPNYKPPKNY